MHEYGSRRALARAQVGKNSFLKAKDPDLEKRVRQSCHAPAAVREQYSSLISAYSLSG